MMSAARWILHVSFNPATLTLPSFHFGLLALSLWSRDLGSRCACDARAIEIGAIKMSESTAEELQPTTAEFRTPEMEQAEAGRNVPEVAKDTTLMTCFISIGFIDNTS